jgi:hypothetical protein
MNEIRDRIRGSGRPKIFGNKLIEIRENDLNKSWQDFKRTGFPDPVFKKVLPVSQDSDSCS